MLEELSWTISAMGKDQKSSLKRQFYYIPIMMCSIDKYSRAHIDSLINSVMYRYIDSLISNVWQDIIGCIGNTEMKYKLK